MLLAWMPERAKADPNASAWINDETFTYKGGHIDCKVDIGNEMYQNDTLSYVWIGGTSADPMYMNAAYCNYCQDSRFYPNQILGTSYYLCQVFDEDDGGIKMCDSNVVAVTFSSVLDTISVDKGPSKYEYEVGEKLSPKGMVVSVVYTNSMGPTTITYYDDEWGSIMDCRCVSEGESDGDINKEGKKAFRLFLKEAGLDNMKKSEAFWVTYTKKVPPTNTPTFTPTNTPTLTPTNTPTATPTTAPATKTPTPKPTATPTPVSGGETKIIGEDSKTYTIIAMNAKGKATATTNLRTIPAYSTDPKYFVKDGGGNKISLPKDTVVDVTGQCKETKYYRIIYKGKECYVSNNYLEIISSTTPTATPTPKPATPTPKPTNTPVPTDSPTPIPTPTETPTPIPTPTETPTPEPTATPEPSPEPSPTPEPTQEAMPTPTEGPADPTPTEEPTEPTPTAEVTEPTPTETISEITPTKGEDPDDPTPTPKDKKKNSSDDDDDDESNGLEFQWWMLAIPGGLILLVLIVMIIALVKRSD